ncbi:hypothetical protein A0O36_02689 [Piscirickettsiaceae bacterium NZ-RLO1]|nr:hypothetical protein A0O36_02689 [Piscirickettsiaceae bacterium NZ-RLO1]
MDLFDSLVKVCSKVRQRLETELRELNAQPMDNIELPHGTKAEELVKNISPLTDLGEIISLSTISQEDIEKQEALTKSLNDLNAADSTKIINELKLKKQRISLLVDHLKNIDSTLSHENLKLLFEEQRDVRKKKEAVEKLKKTSFLNLNLNGLGSDLWRNLWESAKQFSENHAYHENEFPVTDDNALCVLCLQNLNTDAIDRLKQFNYFIISSTEKEFKDSRNKYSKHYKDFENINFYSDIIDDVKIENQELANEIKLNFSSANEIHSCIINDLKAKNGPSIELSGYNSITSKVSELVNQLNNRINNLQQNNTLDKKSEIESQLRELNSRFKLNEFKDKVINEVNRKKKFAAYTLCLNDTKTNNITKKSTEVTRLVVTDKLKVSFDQELRELKFNHVEVELKEVGGDRGNLYHKLTLRRAPNIELPKVVSEGEQRCLSIAAFFAELSTADDPSAILFDDPVSSLDYKWRDAVAQRLVKEAKVRQVMIFTHDVVFLLLLKEYAKKYDVNLKNQYIKQIKSVGAGICNDNLPWIAMPVTKRIKQLNNSLVSAKKNFKNAEQDNYNKEAMLIYGQLRECWERGIEEILLGGIVERYRNSVQTQQILLVSDITVEDCKDIENGMTKCSKWLPGHDLAAGAPQDMPDPDGLQADVDSFNNWVERIKKRRKK